MCEVRAGTGVAGESGTALVEMARAHPPIDERAAAAAAAWTAGRAQTNGWLCSAAVAAAAAAFAAAFPARLAVVAMRHMIGECSAVR